MGKEDTREDALLRTVADPQKALEKWLAEKDDLLAGRKPREKVSGVTVRDAVNHFLSVKRHLVDASELSLRSWQNYHRSCENVIDGLGRDRLVLDLNPDDFTKLRVSLSDGCGQVALANEIRHDRILFKHAYDADLTDRSFRFGPTFKPPKPATIKKARQAAGKRMLEASEIRLALEAASIPLKAKTLLGANCGFGATDCSQLPIKAVDLKGGWIDFPRPKNGRGAKNPVVVGDCRGDRGGN